MLLLLLAALGSKVYTAQNLFSEKEKRMKQKTGGKKKVCDAEFIKWPRPIKNGKGVGGDE